jgi:hypothetical protein
MRLLLITSSSLSIQGNAREGKRNATRTKEAEEQRKKERGMSGTAVQSMYSCVSCEKKDTRRDL